MTDPREIAERIVARSSWGQTDYDLRVLALARAFLALAEDEAALREANRRANAMVLAQQPVIDVTNIDWGAKCQEVALAHLAACQEANMAWEEGNDDVESPASAPFCGCDTCVVREVLWSAWEILLAGRADLAGDVEAEQQHRPESDGDQNQADVLRCESHAP